MKILNCGHGPSEHDSAITTGYGTDSKGKTWCYECIAKNELNEMNESDKHTLYLTGEKSDRMVSNWPGSLKFRPYSVTTGDHNWTGLRINVWFYDDNKNHWYGVSYGDNTQILHCRKLKQ